MLDNRSESCYSTRVGSLRARGVARAEPLSSARSVVFAPRQRGWTGVLALSWHWSDTCPASAGVDRRFGFVLALV